MWENISSPSACQKGQPQIYWHLGLTKILVKGNNIARKQPQRTSSPSIPLTSKTIYLRVNHTTTERYIEVAPSLHPLSLRTNVKLLLLNHTGMTSPPHTEECYYRNIVENIIHDIPCVILRTHYRWRFLSTINRLLLLNQWFNLTDVWTVCLDCFPLLSIARKLRGRYWDHSPRILQYMSCILFLPLALPF